MIIWKNEFETGIWEVDSSNRVLAYEINEFYQEFLKEMKREKVILLLDQIIRIASIKFKIEILFYQEHVLDEIEIIKHAKTHNSLLYILEKARIGYTKGHLSSLIPVAEFLKLWVMEHIISGDKEIVKIGKRNQLKGISAFS